MRALICSVRSPPAVRAAAAVQGLAAGQRPMTPPSCTSRLVRAHDVTCDRGPRSPPSTRPPTWSPGRVARLREAAAGNGVHAADVAAGRRVRQAGRVPAHHRGLRPAAGGASPRAPASPLGGGWIGLEVAAAARLADCPVTVFEKAELPLGRARPRDRQGVRRLAPRARRGSASGRRRSSARSAVRRSRRGRHRGRAATSAGRGGGPGGGQRRPGPRSAAHLRPRRLRDRRHRQP